MTTSEAAQAPAESRLLGCVTGLSMWPALQSGDRLFGSSLDPDLPPVAGQVVVANVDGLLIAHRFRRAAGRRGARRFYLAGDLSGPDAPIAESEIIGVAQVRHRPNRGFSEITPSLNAGPLGRSMLYRLAAWSEFATRAGETRR